MASDLYILDGSLFSDPFSLFPIDLDSSILQTTFKETENYTNQTDPYTFSSPPRLQMESLSLSSYALPSFEVKTEENQNPFSSFLMQRSFSSNNFFFDENRGDYSFNPCFNPVNESINVNPLISDNGYSDIGHMRRVCSTGDLQSLEKMETRHQLSSSPLGSQNSYIEEANIKVGRYNAEEKRERILRYKVKRTQRNFNKTIKYACRKTLADNRPRIRGRFARHDESGEISRTAPSSSYEDEYNIWIDGFNVEGEEGISAEGSLFNILGPSQLNAYRELV